MQHGTSFQIFRILGMQKKLLGFKDPLVQRGGVLTIDMQETDPSVNGIEWILPRVHYRNPGRPTEHRTEVGSRSLNVPFNNLVQVAIGSLINQ